MRTHALHSRCLPKRSLDGDSCRGGRLRHGFSLLEVVLSLSLAVVLMALVGGALQFYAVEMNVRDMDIRQTQLAASVMQMIEDDLRAALHTEPVDTSGLEALLATTATNASGAASDGGSEQDLSAAGIESDDTSDDLEMLEEASSLDVLGGTAVLQTPGLIGNQYQVQIDLSRLPRLEEYMVLLDASVANLDDVPSDLKTVTYYVQAAGSIGGIVDPLESITAASDGDVAAMSEGGGLVRRSLDRAVTVFAASSGGLASLNQTGDLLAPEITGIEFAYWDGVTWQMEWSSDQYGELPLAVQVRLYMPDPKTAIAGTVTDTSSVRTFMHVVRLPLARPVDLEDPELTGAGI